MREIKFRAWDKKNKQMIDEIFCIGKNPDGSTWISHVNGFASEYIWASSNLEYMQYTGLKDKNDKEIYEGDIMVHPDFCSEDKLTVEIKNGCTFIGGWDCVRTYLWKGEVIGNIHENPELLGREQGASVTGDKGEE